MREAVNPRTGRRERVFVNLEAVYPDYKNPNHEVSFEELRAINRGWMDMDWGSQKKPLKQISGNVAYAEGSPADRPGKDLPDQFNQKLSIKADSHQSEQVQDHDAYEGKAGKARKLKLREVKGEPQTGKMHLLACSQLIKIVKMNFDSPTKNKVRRKSTSEPTMTMHTRAATDEIYDIFNQPLRAESDQRDSSDFEDDDCTSVGESTVTGHISVASSDFGDDETHTFHRSYDGDDTTQAGSVVGNDWTEFTNTSGAADNTTQHIEDGPDESTEKPERERFIPEMPDDYDPPTGLYRDPEIMAQNRLPFMTPIVEQTEHSFPSATAARSHTYNSKTPSKPMLNSRRTPSMPPIEDLLLSPLPDGTPHEKGNYASFEDEVSLSPSAKKAISSPRIPLPERRRDAIIKDKQCNPTDGEIRGTIIKSLDPPLASYQGYHAHHEEDSNYASEVQKFMKSLNRRHKSGGESTLEVPILEFPDAERSYIVKRELGAGAYAPVYLAESIDGAGGESERDYRRTNDDSWPRYGFEALKLEVGPPSAWEFYMIRTAHERMIRKPELSRAASSIIRAHELHVFKKESFLIEDYRGQGTLLDLVNTVRNESIASSSGEGGLDEALAMFFTVELFRTVEALHACGILHGDIKADNCLIRFDGSDPRPSLLGVEEEEEEEENEGEDSDDSEDNETHYSPRGTHGWNNKGLSLIDFGRSIDMHAFDPSVQFIADWDPSTHECNEVREMRPWTHQIDLYGLAGVIHVMLFGKYLESTPSPDPKSPGSPRTYRIRETLKRYWDRELWADVFDLLLNPGAERWVDMEKSDSGHPATVPALPVLRSMRYLRERMEGWLVANAGKKGLASQIRKLERVFMARRRKLEKR